MNIIKNRKKFLAFSIILIAVGIVVMIINMASGKGAFNLDVEFTGGMSLDISIGQEFNNDDIADIIKDVTGQTSPYIQKIINSNDVSIKMQSVDSETRTALLDALKENYNISDEDISLSDISATVSGEMQKKAFIAVIVACVAMLIYISIRFKDYRAGLSAIIALVHDVLIVITFYAILRIPVNNSFIAALLTVLGYSINATIVIFDRIRENTALFKSTEERINKSVYQSLSRSINTSLTTLFTIGAIYVFGVASIKEFALPLVIGIISGAYSSVFLSGSIWYMLLPKSMRSTV